jgi:hypothetical protein
MVLDHESGETCGAALYRGKAEFEEIHMVLLPQV